MTFVHDVITVSIARFHDVLTDLKFVKDVPVIDHYDYRTNTVYHGAVDLGDVMVRSINIDQLKVTYTDI